MTPLHITVLGATGMAGSRIVAEAAARGHHVTGAGRSAPREGRLPAGVRFRAGDAADPAQVAALAAGQDVLVQSTRPAPGREHEMAVVTKAVLAGLTGSTTRLLVVGGAGSLTVPGNGGTAAVDDPAFVPPQWREVAQASVEQYELVRVADDVDWTYLCPSAFFEPGERTGRFRIGTDELLVDAAGRSAVSAEDLAVALLDEVEQPAHRGRRFTVGY